MKNYDVLLIFPPDETPDQRQANLKTIEDLVKKFSGTVTQKIELGKKVLGYSLRKFREGYVWAIELQVHPSKIQEVRNALQLQENLLKFMITIKVPVKIKVSAHPAPAAKPPIPGRPAGSSSPAAVTSR